MAQNRTEVVISALNETQAAFAGLKESLKGLDGQLGQVSQSGKKTSQSFKDSFGSLKAALLGTGVVMALKQLVDAANQVERSNTALAVTARYAGVSMQEAKVAAKSLTEDGLMSMAEASQGLQNLLSRGFSLGEAIELMKRFKDSAAFNRQASLEFGQAVVTATEGLKNENSVLVDNAGVTKNVSIMWKEYAAQHGKSADQLTIAEKRQAEYNGILRETEGQLGNTGRMTETFAGQMAKLNQEIFDFKAQAGREITPILADLAKGLRPVISLLRDFVGGFEMAAVSFAAWFDKIAVFMAAGGLTGLMTSGKMRDLVRKQFAEIDKAAEETKAEIYKRFDVGETVDIGPDTGKRRTDIIIPGKTGGSKKSKTSKTENLPSAYTMMSKDLDAFSGKMAKWWESEDKASKKAVEDAAKELEMKQQIREAEIQYQLSLIDTAEANHQVTKAEAADQRLTLSKELLSVQEQWLGTMDKATDASGWLAQAQAIEETRRNVLNLELAVREMSDDFGGGFVEGIRQMVQDANSLFQEGEQLAKGFADNLNQAFDDGFFSLLTGKFENLGDVLQSFFEGIARQISNILSQRATNSIISGIGKLFGGASSWTENAKGNAFASPSLSKYSGQVVSKPTVFKFAYGGVGVMGEGSDAEGIFPLARDRGGKLGVRAMGGNGAVTSNVVINMDAAGNVSRTQSSGGMTPALATQLGRMIDGAVMDVLVKQKRAGGLLA